MLSNQVIILYVFSKFPKVYQKQKIYQPNYEIDTNGQHTKYEFFYDLNDPQKQQTGP